MSVQELEGLKRRINFFVSMDDVRKEVEKELKKIQRTAKIQGFRPGKVPLKVLEKHYGPKAHNDALNTLLGIEYNKAIQAEGLEVAGMPEITVGDNAQEGSQEFVATFEVYPTFDLPNFAELDVKRFVCPVTEAEAEKTITVLRQQRASFEPVADRPAEDGDRLTVDFVGKIDGEAFAGGSAENYKFFLGHGQMLPEFEAAAKGLKAGESKTFPLSFPENYHGKEVAGKTAEFTITVKEVCPPVLPELTPEFVKSLGQADGNVENFRKEVLENIAREAKNRLLLRGKGEVFAKLVESTEVQLPESLVKAQLEQRIAAARQELKQRQVPNFETVELPLDTFRKEVERGVKLQLIAQKIVKENNIKVDPAQVRAKIEEFAQSYEKPSEFVSYYLTNRERRAEIENMVLEQNLVDFVLEQAKVVEEPIAFEVLMGSL